jgi:hypothetical protein
MFSIITLCFTVRNVVSCGHSGRSINDEDDDAHEDDFVQEEEDGDDNDNDVQEDKSMIQRTVLMTMLTKIMTVAMNAVVHILRLFRRG